MREVQIRVAGWMRTASDHGGPRFLPITGVFDDETALAVRRFQEGYQLPETDGVVGEATRTCLRSLAKADGSTRNFEWIEMTRTWGPGPLDPNIRENARRTLFKLEALRRKLGDVRIYIKIGYDATGAQTDEDRIGGNSQHAIAAAVDVAIPDRPRPLWYQTALTCGFTGLGPAGRHWQHCDSRLEYLEPGNELWYADGDGR